MLFGIIFLKMLFGKISVNRNHAHFQCLWGNVAQKWKLPGAYFLLANIAGNKPANAPFFLLLIIPAWASCVIRVIVVHLCAGAAVQQMDGCVPFGI